MVLFPAYSARHRTPYDPLGAGTAIFLHAADVSAGVNSGKVGFGQPWVDRKSSLSFSSGPAINQPTKTSDYVQGAASVANISVGIGTLLTSESSLYAVARVYVVSDTSTAILFELTAGFSAADGGWGVGSSFSGGGHDQWSGGARGSSNYGYGDAGSSITGAWHTVTWHIDTSVSRGMTQLNVDGSDLSMSTVGPGCGSGNFANDTLYMFNRAANTLPADWRVKAAFVLHGSCGAAHLAGTQAYCTALGS